jgi:hypothetical protein
MLPNLMHHISILLKHANLIKIHKILSHLDSLLKTIKPKLFSLFHKKMTDILNLLDKNIKTRLFNYLSVKKISHPTSEKLMESKETSL